MTHKCRIWLIVLALLLSLAALTYRYATPGTKQTARTVQAVPVTAALAKKGNVPILLEMVGRAEAYESVTLKARVDGQVATVAYTEGQTVQSGDILLRLDDRDFSARLKQAEANLAKAEAQWSKARSDWSRYLSLKERGFVSEEKVHEYHTAETAAAASVNAEKAATELARLQLSYTTIRAPFAGKVGARLVFPGSSVKINDTALAVINRVRPLLVTFSVPEKHIPRLRASLLKDQLKALVTIPGNQEIRFEGPVKFIDNTVDASTGTIQMKALLDNADQKLTPGQFLNVTLTLDTLTEAVVVPSEAVQQGRNGYFLFVVNPDNTADLRTVTVGASYEGISALTQGVHVGETVVTDGQLRLTQGIPVQVKMRPPPSEMAQPRLPH